MVDNIFTRQLSYFVMLALIIRVTAERADGSASIHLSFHRPQTTALNKPQGKQDPDYYNFYVSGYTPQLL